jgi:hypothetical protein
MNERKMELRKINSQMNRETNENSQLRVMGIELILE